MDFILRKFNFRNDIQDLFDIMVDPDYQMLFHRRLAINTLPDFDAWLQANFKGNFHEFYVVSDKRNLGMIGFVYSYDYSPVDCNCKFVLVLRKDIQGTGLGVMVGIQFLDVLFRNYPLKKVFSLVYDYNSQSLQSQTQAGFCHEGEFKECRYYDGKFHDLHILSMSRETFYEKYSGVLKSNG